MDETIRTNHSPERLPVEVLLDVIGGKWKVRLLALLQQEGPIRFSELRDRLPGITQKVLSQQLRQMQRDGLVTRTVFAEVPPRVEYALTPLGASLCEPLAELSEWSREHLPQAQAQAQTETELNAVGSASAGELDGPQ